MLLEMPGKGFKALHATPRDCDQQPKRHEQCQPEKGRKKLSRSTQELAQYRWSPGRLGGFCLCDLVLRGRSPERTIPLLYGRRSSASQCLGHCRMTVSMALPDSTEALWRLKRVSERALVDCWIERVEDDASIYSETGDHSSQHLPSTFPRAARGFPSACYDVRARNRRNCHRRSALYLPPSAPRPVCPPTTSRAGAARALSMRAGSSATSATKSAGGRQTAPSTAWP